MTPNGLSARILAEILNLVSISLRQGAHLYRQATVVKFLLWSDEAKEFLRDVTWSPGASS